jgi:hypothetical protein
MNIENRIPKAIETFDHLLWEAIIRVCGIALSKAFKREGNSVRVVYEIRDPGLNFWREKPFYLDPRGHLDLIKKEIDYFISSTLPIKKEMSVWRFSREANAMCSNWCYNHFLFTIASETIARLSGIKENPTSENIGDRQMWEDFLQNQMPMVEKKELVNCAFVIIGWSTLPGCICCPCVGEHLNNTSELKDFRIELSEPKKVGNDAYEFRFSIR